VASAVKFRPIVRGAAAGSVLLCARPISLWGGVDPGSGTIIDRRHDRHGESIAGRVFALPGEKGSSTGSAVLLELIRIGKAPAAIVTRLPSPALTLGAIVAEELYGNSIPIFLATEAGFRTLRDGERIHIAENGEVRRATTADRRP
jgi:predicted aconitase with swiveling domain